MSRHETHQMALDLAEFLCGAVRRDAEWMDLVAKNRALRTENEQLRDFLKDIAGMGPLSDIEVARSLARAALTELEEK